jgi:hypothetical protein
MCTWSEIHLHLHTYQWSVLWPLWKISSSLVICCSMAWDTKPPPWTHMVISHHEVEHEESVLHPNWCERGISPAEICMCLTGYQSLYFFWWMVINLWFPCPMGNHKGCSQKFQFGWSRMLLQIYYIQYIYGIIKNIISHYYSNQCGFHAVYLILII